MLGFGIFLPGWWLELQSSAAACDIMVVLAGNFNRPLYAAELYHQGYAPEIWLSRPRPRPSLPCPISSASLGSNREEELNREILVRRGVPRNTFLLRTTSPKHAQRGRRAESRAASGGQKYWSSLSLARPAFGLDIQAHAAGIHDLRGRSSFDRFASRLWRNRELSEAAVLEPPR